MKQLGTDSCIYILKELLLNYTKLNSNIFLCFLDASKAFNRINYGKLFKKLLNTPVPKFLIRILTFWYSHQQMRVKWGGSLSSPFKLKNGVRQGSVLSPFLFNFYLNDLSTTLNTFYIGCATGNVIINHLIYADDIVLISPSVKGLNKLLLTCEQYAKDHDILFNPNKSVSMIVKAKKSNISPTFNLNGTP